MNRYEIKITKEEDERCQRMIRLFEDFLQKREGLCVVRTERYGYVVLLGARSNSFEENVICRNAKEIYDELMRIWEVDYLYETGMENGCEDFDSSEENMTPAQREYRDKVRHYYGSKAEEIF